MVVYRNDLVGGYVEEEEGDGTPPGNKDKKIEFVDDVDKDGEDPPEGKDLET